MTESVAAVPSDLVDHARLSAYLGEHLGESHASFTIKRLGQGQSCLTFLLSGPDWSLILRRPPRGDLPPTAFDVRREHRVMSALAGADTAVPVPEPVLLCEDGEVIGSPFYLMRPVAGTVLRHTAPAGLTAHSSASLSIDFVDVLASLHEVDWRAAGLDGFGNPGAYAERQMHRMSSLWQRARFRDLPEVEDLERHLAATVPAPSESTIVHGDYKLDNVIVDETAGKVSAVVDWELSTIGDPLADLGWLLYFWMDDPAEQEWTNMPAVTLAPGFPTREEMVARYRSHREAPAESIAWYAALAGWKCAVMLEESYSRHVDGVSDIADHAALEQGVPYLARRGMAFATGGLST
jgi:aminoglycoside phosphotransferase (APT) family kinase protein